MSIFKTLSEKSWATPRSVSEINPRDISEGLAAKTGLKFFIGVLSSMFFLFCVGYKMRMELSDWVPLQDPNLLWFNTAILVLSSIAMQLAKNAAMAGKIKKVRLYLTAAGGLTIGFLIGQITVWQELLDAGLYQLSSAPLAFFILLTGLHGLHLTGGLFVWARSVYKAWLGMEIERFKLTIELCTTYWHYLMLVWFVFFALLLAT
ncbi:MAG: cytochrome c oxidase subunit 3 [Pseudomonadota bacterium]|nr:cytochrome c oxidase subunit 3 [Pseudomonadota bacterium]